MGTSRREPEAILDEVKAFRQEPVAVYTLDHVIERAQLLLAVQPVIQLKVQTAAEVYIAAPDGIKYVRVLVPAASPAAPPAPAELPGGGALEHLVHIQHRVLFHELGQILGQLRAVHGKDACGQYLVLRENHGLNCP